MDSSNSTENLYQQYKQQLRKVADLKYAAAVLQWDQETYLPEKGCDFRGQQLATLNEIGHEMFIADKTGNILQELLSRDLSADKKRNVERTWEDYERLKKLTPEFVRKLTEAVSASFHAWIEARKQNDFAVFEPKLAPLVNLKMQEAELYGYTGHPYNALMNEY
jgi:carboxypeptidase Taq